MSSMRFALESLPPAMRQQAEAQLRTGAVVRNAKSGQTIVKKSRSNKYHARRVEAHGIQFGSLREARKYRELKVLERAKEISELRAHVRFALFDPGENCRGEYIGRYTCDFTWKADGKLVVADAKSRFTKKLREWPRTKALMRACHGIEVIEL